MAQYSVTGCIVTHNNTRTIVKAISTILKYTRDIDFTLYIADNLSTDGTVELIRKKFGRFPNIIINETGTNRGFGAGHNSVLPLLKSKYHIIINPDVVLKDNVISKMASFMDENDDIGLLSPRICFPDGRNQVLGKRNPKIRYLVASRMRNDKAPGKLLREYAMLDCDMSKPTDIENATGCFMMLRTELFKAVGGFDENYFMYFEDCDLTRSVCKTSRAVYYPQAVVCHVWGRESKKNTKLMAIQLKSMFYYFWKWRHDD